MLLISLFDVCGTYVDNCDIFIELPEVIFVFSPPLLISIFQSLF